MKYVGIYWTVFAPLIKQSITKRFNKELADQAIRQGKGEYRRLLSRADELGPGNPMVIIPCAIRPSFRVFKASDPES